LVSHQRSISTVDDKMEQEHLDKLNSIWFVWSVRGQSRSARWGRAWNDKFEMLVHYKQEHGGCLALCQSYKVDPSLGRWVETAKTIRQQ
jgi:hypothetical protein